MKKFILTICSFSLLSHTFSSENTLSVSSDIKEVTVYLSGAQIKREGNISLKKGINYIRFDHVSPYLNSNTIQVKGTGLYTILDVKKSSRYPEPSNTKEEKIPRKIQLSISKLIDSITDYNYLITDLTSKISYLKIEKDMLLKNGVFSKDSLASLKESLNYLREKLLDLHQKEQQYLKQKNRTSNELSEMNQRLIELQNYSSNHLSTTNQSPIHYIEVTIQSTNDTKGKLDVSYYVQQAGWSPIYDIRVKNTSSPVELMMKANIYQNSGEDWNEVPLTLSTNNPLRNKMKPQLQIWYLNYYYGQNGIYNTNQIDYNSETLGVMEDAMIPESNERLKRTSSNSPAKLSTDYVVQSNLMASANYNISLPYTVKSNNQAHLVAVKKHEISCDYKYYIVPKYDKDAYIIANLVDWEDLDLLPSKANIFYDGTYIGETRINPTANDTLSLSLGNDPQIFAKRKKNKDKTKNKILSNNKETIISYDLTIKNNTKNNIEVIVQDHIPVSMDKTIKIELENKSKAKHEEDKGMLTWTFKLGNSSKEFNYTYKITYEKDKSINSLIL